MPDRLVICLDGTWNSTFTPVERENGTNVLKPTNPLKVARAVLPIDHNGNRQITYYDSGVGALGIYPGLSNRLLYLVDSRLGGGFGAGFEGNVEQAVNFIALNHADGAEIYVFGFSRGAAQARALTNFLAWLGGIPTKADAYYVPVFFRHYLEQRGGGSPRDVKSSTGDLPAERLRPLKIMFIGVWDTVMALGSRLRATKNTSVAERSFHVRHEPADCVMHARQALALDELRFDFRPEIWTNKKADQTLEQRWFPGMHAHVGGSYGNDGLANCALHWITDEARSLGLALDQGFLAKYRPYPQDEMKDSYSLKYRAIETLRCKAGKGERLIEGNPASAHLSLDPSVIKRLCSDPQDFSTMNRRYRPASVVQIAALFKKDPDAFLKRYGLNPEVYRFPKDI